jgi:hypothetical protein
VLLGETRVNPRAAVAALRREVGEPKAFATLTEARDNSKFVLVRVSYE